MPWMNWHGVYPFIRRLGYQTLCRKFNKIFGNKVPPSATSINPPLLWFPHHTVWHAFPPLLCDRHWRGYYHPLQGGAGGRYYLWLFFIKSYKKDSNNKLCSLDKKLVLQTSSKLTFLGSTFPYLLATAFVSSVD